MRPRHFVVGKRILYYCRDSSLGSQHVFRSRLPVASTRHCMVYVHEIKFYAQSLAVVPVHSRAYGLDTGIYGCSSWANLLCDFWGQQRTPSFPTSQSREALQSGRLTRHHVRARCNVYMHVKKVSRGKVVGLGDAVALRRNILQEVAKITLSYTPRKPTGFPRSWYSTTEFTVMSVTCVSYK